MKKLFSLIILSILILIPVSNYASEEIIVSGSKENTPSSVDVAPLSDSDRQVKTLTGILESHAGIQVTRYGTPGSYSSIFVRGTNANQLSVYIDGIPLSDSVFGEVNLENIPLDSIERIEIYKSFAPLSFATPGIGGVINLVTKKNRPTTETGISISAGSFGTYRLSAFNSYSAEPSDLLVSGSVSASNGDFRFKNNNGTVFNAEDDFTDRRKNNEYKSGNVTARYSRSSGDISIDVLSNFLAKNQGVASYNNMASSSSLNTLQSLNYARVTFTEIGSLPLSEQISVFANARRDVFNNLEGEIDYLAQKNKGTYLTCGAGSYTTSAFKKIFQELSLSLQWQNEYYYITNEFKTASESYPAQRRTTLAAGFEDNISILDERLVITPQVRCQGRHDHFKDRSDSPAVFSCDPQIGAFLWIMKNLLYVKGSYGLNHRAPSFSELFGNMGTVQGNSQLGDEKSDNLNVTTGISYTDFSSTILQAFNIEYSFFMTRISNVIIFIQNSQKTMTAQNISAASITGHELTAGLTALSHIDLSCNATLQFAKDRSDIAYYEGNYLPNRPILQGNAVAKLFITSASIAYQFSYAGGNYRDRANSDSLYVKQRVYHTITAVWMPHYDTTITLEARNISNNQTLDVAGYPLPGISFTGSVQYIF